MGFFRILGVVINDAGEADRVVGRLIIGLAGSRRPASEVGPGPSSIKRSNL